MREMRGGVVGLGADGSDEGEVMGFAKRGKEMGENVILVARIR